MLPFCLSRRVTRLLFAASAIVVLLFFFFFVWTDHYHSLPQPDLLAVIAASPEEIVTPAKQWPTNGSSLAVKAFCKIARLIIGLVDDTSPLPLDYSSENNPKPQCEDTYGLTYLFHLRDSRASYCSAHSASTLHCFRARIQETREDSFCLVENVWFNGNDKFNVRCELRDFREEEDLVHVPPISKFPVYMYDTGPKRLIENFLKIDPDFVDGLGEPDRICPPEGESPGYKILIRREGAGNPWHTLLEIFSLYLTLDALYITPTEGGAGSFFNSSSLANSQVVIVDDIENGPFFDLWGLLTGRPTVRIRQVRDDINFVSCPQNIILPLPGGSNPLWYSDWHPQNCHQSALLDVFSKRLRDFFHVPDFHEDNSQLKLTIIDRKATRKLHNLDAYMTKLRVAYPKVTINAVDLAAYSFADQLEIIRNTDILVGVHGAGLIHSLFLPPHSAVVEIFPADVSYPVYRNLAKLRGHQYFSDHALVAASGQDWHGLDIEIGEYAFAALVDVAVKSMLNRGTLSEDVS